MEKLAAEQQTFGAFNRQTNFNNDDFDDKT
jgi:hypothetical protein